MFSALNNLKGDKYYYYYFQVWIKRILHEQELEQEQGQEQELNEKEIKYNIISKTELDESTRGWY